MLTDKFELFKRQDYQQKVKELTDARAFNSTLQVKLANTEVQNKLAAEKLKQSIKDIDARLVQEAAIRREKEDLWSHAIIDLEKTKKELNTYVALCESLKLAGAE